MSIVLSLSATDLDQESLQHLTRQLCQDLREELITATLPSTDITGAGTKGNIEVIGQVLITAVGASGAITALFNMLKVYVQRKPSLQFEIQTKSGEQIKLHADDLRSDQMAKLLQIIEPMIKETE